MYQIIQGYKQGRAVMFYDLRDMDGVVKEKVHKDDVVKLIESNQVSNTKVQWWEGKPIVRMGDKNVPIVKLGNDGENLGNISPVTRSHTKVENEKPVSSTVVGKVSKKKSVKESIAYGGYSVEHKIAAQELKNSINYKQYGTLKDLFLAMANEYGLRHTDKYLEQFAKKVNVDKPITLNNMSYVLGIQNSINIYLMNMAGQEMNETFMKYNVF